MHDRPSLAICRVPVAAQGAAVLVGPVRVCRAPGPAVDGAGHAVQLALHDPRHYGACLGSVTHALECIWPAAALQQSGCSGRPKGGAMRGQCLGASGRARNESNAVCCLGHASMLLCTNALRAGIHGSEAGQGERPRPCEKRIGLCMSVSVLSTWFELEPF